MKKISSIALAVFIPLITSLVISCPQPPVFIPDDIKTFVRFDNSQGTCTAVIFNDYRRQDYDKIAEVPAGQVSAAIEWTPGSSVPFYFSYIVRLNDISGFSFNYVPEIGRDQTAVRIDADTTTTITIPGLDETLSSPDQLLSNSSFILIQNNSSYPFELHRGNSPVIPDLLSSPRINSGERAQYEINPETSSNYKLLVGGRFIPFTSTLDFKAGFIYSFVFDGDGSVSLITETQTILDNVAGHSKNITAPGTPDSPTVRALDGHVILQWNVVEGAENYEIYRSTTQTPPLSPIRTVPGTSIILDNLLNGTTYYIWIKAINEAGSSDLSPRTQVTPWSSNEVPAVPQRPVIIDGVNRLTVSWNECGGAEFYEVFIDTRNVIPSAPAITTDKTNAVIMELENGIDYFVWVRAVNGAGNSRPSLSEIGIPRHPTAAPASPAQPVLAAGSRELNVSWQAVELASSYEVWVGTTDNTENAVRHVGDITGTDTVITGLENGTTYFVWIKSKNIIGTSGFSPEASAAPSAFAALPVTPAAPSVTAGSRQLSINWPESEGALAYEVWSSTTNNPASAEKHGADVSGGTSVTLTTGLENDTTYFFWIRAKNNIGISGFSPYTSGTPSEFVVPPVTPQTAPAVTAGIEQLTVSWQAVEGAVVYEIWVGTTVDLQAAIKHGNDVSGLSTVITDLNNGTTYYVWIRAKNDIGESDFSPAENGTPQVFAIPPQAPSAPSITIGNGQLSITWDAVNGAATYEVWISTANNFANVTQHGTDITASLSTTIGGLNNGTTYYVWLKAKNEFGTSDFSSVATGKPISNITTPSLTAGNGQIIVNWTAIDGADQYEIFYGTGINPPQNAAQTINAPATSATITGLVNGTTYNVWIRGRNSTGTGIMGNSVSAVPIGNMGAVTINAGNEQLLLNWVSVAGADEYEVFYSTVNSIPASLSQIVSTTTATLNGLSNGTTYFVWVRGRNSKGTSGTSAVLRGKPLGTPGMPAITPGFRNLYVTWDSVPGADEYEVYFGIGSATSLATTTTGTSATITGLTNGTTYHIRLRAKNTNGVSEYGPTTNSTPGADMSSGLYRGSVRIGNQNLTSSLSWISTNAVAGDEFYIVLGTNETISPVILGYSDRNVGITLLGSGSERTVSLNSNGSMFTVNAGVTLTLDENVTLVGRSANNASLVNVNQSGTLVMNDGAKISGNNSGTAIGGGVYVGGTFLMHGGIIKGNTARGGGVFVFGGIVTMYGGTISGNTSLSQGGGVEVGSGIFTMYGGIISGNIASNYGGGVYVNYPSAIFKKLSSRM